MSSHPVPALAARQLALAQRPSFTNRSPEAALLVFVASTLPLRDAFIVAAEWHLLPSGRYERRADIASALGLTEERVRQLLRAAERRLAAAAPHAPSHTLRPVHRTLDALAEQGDVAIAAHWRDAAMARGVAVTPTSLATLAATASVLGLGPALHWVPGLQAWVVAGPEAARHARLAHQKVLAARRFATSALLQVGACAVQDITALAPFGVPHVLRVMRAEQPDLPPLRLVHGHLIAQRTECPLHRDALLTLEVSGAVPVAQLSAFAEATRHRGGARARAGAYRLPAPIVALVLRQDPARRFVFEHETVRLAPWAVAAMPDGLQGVLLDAVRAAGGIASYSQIQRALTTHGYSANSVVSAGACTFLERAGYGHYRLRGTTHQPPTPKGTPRVGVRTVATHRRGVSSRDTVQTVALHDDRCELRIRVTSEAERGIIRIPSSLPIRDGAWTWEAPDGGQHQLAVLHGVLTGVGRILHTLGAPRGGRVTLTFTLATGVLRAERTRGRPAQPAPLVRARRLSKEQLATLRDSPLLGGIRPLASLLGMTGAAT